MGGEESFDPAPGAAEPVNRLGCLHQPAPVWLALARDQVEMAPPACVPETRFAVRVQIRQPRGQQPRVLGGLVKGIFDGVISAFQAHTDKAVVAARLATVPPADPIEIEELLLDRRRAVLGVVPRLVSLHDVAVQWNPEDDRCVAGELLPAEPVGPRLGDQG